MAQIQFTPYVRQENNTFNLPKLEDFNIPVIKSKPKQKEEEKIVLAPLPKIEMDPLPQETPQIIKGIVDNSKNYNIGNMQNVIDAFSNAGINIRITSGVRPGAMTKSGNRSHHSFGNAIDITPNFAQGETWESMRQKLKVSKELQQFMHDNKFGIIDETTPEVMAKTGATGAHWHVGPDQWALRNFETLIAKKGAKLQNGNTISYTPLIQDREEWRNGIYEDVHFVDVPPKPYKPKYDLSKNPFIDESDFNRWYSYIASVKNLSPNPDDPEHHYDWRGLYDEVANHGKQYEMITQETHFPDTYKMPGHETFSIESKYYKPGMIAGHWEGETYRTTPFSLDEMEARQQYAETRFKKGRVSSAGARGAYQFMPATWAGLNKKYGTNLNIENYNDNKQMRDLYMDDLMHNDLIRFADEPSRIALAYAAYNMGIGNLKKFIEKEQAKGIDVYTTWDWIDDLNPETKKYVNFIVRGIDGNGDLTNVAFNKALPNRYKEFPEVNNN